MGGNALEMPLADDIFAAPSGDGRVRIYESHGPRYAADVPQREIATVLLWEGVAILAGSKRRLLVGGDGRAAVIDVDTRVVTNLALP
jgi:hypothetical protein